jgi:predicted nucleic acid-binding protein
VRTIVVDASSLLEYLLGTGSAGPIAGVLREGDADLHVPALCDVEVAAGLRRAILRGSLTQERAREALADHLDLPLSRHGHRALLDRILELRDNFSAYDAAYVALTEHLAATLLTADAPLARAVRAHLPLPLAH